LLRRASETLTGATGTLVSKWRSVAARNVNQLKFCAVNVNGPAGEFAILKREGERTKVVPGNDV